MMRLMRMNAAEWPFIVIGCIAALIQGASQPIYAVLFGAMIGVSSSFQFLPIVTYCYVVCMF